MTDRLAEMFQAKKEFLKTLAPIYRRNHFPDWSIPFELNGRHDQEYFRLLAWRVNEELIEAVEVYYECIDTESYEGKFREEMVDSLHFLIELCLATGVSEGELVSGFEGHATEDYDYLGRAFLHMGKCSEETIPQRVAFVGYKLGLAMHCLRQRPWRTDDRPTNRSLFVARMYGTWSTYIAACIRSHISAEALYEAFFAKSKINDQRIAEQKL